MPCSVGVHTRLLAGIERGDRGDLRLGESKIENVDVLGDAVGVR